MTGSYWRGWRHWGALQLQLSSVSERDGKDYVGFMGKKLQRRKSHLVQSNTIIQDITDFWAKAVSRLLLLGVGHSGGEERAEAGGGVEMRTQAR